MTIIQRGEQMDDKTFCLNGWRGECGVSRCERHPDNIRDKGIPHSFSEFYKTEYCPLERSTKEKQPGIIYCVDCVNHVDGYFCIKANRHTGDSEYCAEVFGAKER